MCIRDSYNDGTLTGAVRNSVSIKVGDTDTGIDMDKNTGTLQTFQAKAGDIVTVTATVGDQAYYALVSVEAGELSGLFTVPVHNGKNVATFAMPADDAAVTVVFKYGSTSKMQYDTIISPEGGLITSILYGDELQIMAADIVAYLGFSAYGPFSYTPSLEDLTFTSTNPEVATVDEKGLIKAQSKAGYTYIIVRDDRGNQGFLKVQVSPSPSAEGTRTVAFPMIAVGKDYTIALKADGSVWSWGSNSNGQLGVPRGTIQSTTPTEVQVAVTTMGGDGTLQTIYEPLTDIVKIATGAGHSLALAADGTLYAWGDNSTGALGVNASGAGGVYYTATKVLGVSGNGYLGADLYSSAIVDIVAAGGEDSEGKRAYSFALDKSGRLFGWGYNYHGVIDPTYTETVPCLLYTSPSPRDRG